jgi:succinyl-CoA synthetase beta subunit
MAEMGVNVPLGYPATTVEEAVAAAAKIGDEEVVIKSQILAGGRGLGKFTNGLQGGVHVIKTSEVSEYASKMLGGTLVTKQVPMSLFRFEFSFFLTCYCSSSLTTTIIPVWRGWETSQ